MNSAIRKQGRSSISQRDLFQRNQTTYEKAPNPNACQIVPVGKRRDGGTRYWCLEHKADATAKYGKPAAACRAAHVPPIGPEESLELDIDKYRGGVALWGAVPAIYDTATFPMDRGVHVHARSHAGGEKEIDRTFRAVRVSGERLPHEGILVTELEAIYYMVASVFEYEMQFVACSYCGYPHLDKDYFSVHPHRRHLCAGCGKHFRDVHTAVGNPIVGIQQACGVAPHKPRLSTKTLDINQADFPGGIQIWGSNAALLWTSDRQEEAGIHVHAFPETGGKPDPDETFGQVTIDGFRLDPMMVRVLMAQSALPSIKGRIVHVECSSCKKPHFSVGERAFTPSAKHTCTLCGREFSREGRLRKTIGNPLLDILKKLEKNAPRKPQVHDLGLLTETL